MRKDERKIYNTMFEPMDQLGTMRKSLPVVIVMFLCIWGGILLLENVPSFWITLKQEHDVQDLLDNGAREGMYVLGEAPYTYDCFADMSDFDGGRVSAYYYALPAEEGMLILNVPVEMRDAMETLLNETLDYLEGGALPASTVPIEGYVTKARGRLPYLLGQYMLGIGYTQEEIDAMGEPLMIECASESLQKARLYAPIGAILLAVGILLAVFLVWRRRRKAE